MNKARETRERHTDKFHNSMSSLVYIYICTVEEKINISYYIKKKIKNKKKNIYIYIYIYILYIYCSKNTSYHRFVHSNWSKLNVSNLRL